MMDEDHRRRRPTRAVWIVLAAVVAAAGHPRTSPLLAQGGVCGASSNTPLPDLTTSYRGLDFGLYPGRRTTPPDEHLAVGLEAARAIRPLDANGRPDSNGRIVLMSLGMSNTSTEFARFIDDTRRNPALNKRLAIVNGSLSGADAGMWTNRDSFPWRNAIAAATRPGSSVQQVQAVWVKQAHLQTAPFPQEVELLRGDLESIVRTAESVFPNLRLVYLSGRTRAGGESRRGPGEPQAYETAFAVRRVIQDQIEGRDTLKAWIGWGPYLWSNGTPRSDGFVWECRDVRPDMIHPSESGSQKVSDQLMAFFMTAETSTWFLEPSLRLRDSRLAISPSATAGAAPLTVDFETDAAGAVRYFWSFEDGTFSTERTARKTFHVNGSYDVRLTTVDGSGRWERASVAIRVGS